MTELTDEFGDPIYVVLINTQTIVQNNQKDIANDLEQEIAKAMLNYFLEAMIGDNQLMLLVQMMRTHPNGIEELLDRENVTTYAHANVREVEESCLRNLSVPCFSSLPMRNANRTMMLPEVEKSRFENVTPNL